MEIDKLTPAEILEWVNTKPEFESLSDEEKDALASAATKRIYPLDIMQEEIDKLTELISQLRVDVDKIKDLHNIDAKLDLLIAKVGSKKKGV